MQRAHERTRIIEFQNFEIYVDRDYRVNNVQDCYYQLTVKYATNALRVQRLFQTYDRPYIYIYIYSISGNKITITIARRLRNVITVVITISVRLLVANCDSFGRRGGSDLEFKLITGGRQEALEGRRAVRRIIKEASREKRVSPFRRSNFFTHLTRTRYPPEGPLSCFTRVHVIPSSPCSSSSIHR